MAQIISHVAVWRKIHLNQSLSLTQANKQRQVGKPVENELYTPEVSASRPDIMTQVFHSFSQSLQAIVMITPKLSRNIILHILITHYSLIVLRLDAVGLR